MTGHVCPTLRGDQRDLTCQVCGTPAAGTAWAHDADLPVTEMLRSLTVPGVRHSTVEELVRVFADLRAENRRLRATIAYVEALCRPGFVIDTDTVRAALRGDTHG